MPTFPWRLTLVLAVLVALGFAAWHSAELIRRDERRQVLAEGATLADLRLEAERRQWARERDSLQALVAQVDTVVRVRIRHVLDTLWLPADTSPAVRLSACRVTLDQLAADCDTYRRTASAALAKADVLHRADSLAVAALSARVVLLRDSLSHTARQRDRRPTWRLTALTAGVVWLATFVR